MECTQYREWIQEQADGTLGAIQTAELQRHLDDCDDCRVFAGDMEAIREAAESLEPLTPPGRAWVQIAGRLRQDAHVVPRAVESHPRARHVALVAIAATLVFAVGTSIVMLMPYRSGSGSRAETPPGNAAQTDAVQSVETEFRLAEQHYQNAIVKLEEAARLDRVATPGQSGEHAEIDPQTAAMLQKNLQVIDRAIGESRTALRAEPQSAPARDSLFSALRRKVALLQDTIALMNEMRKGNSAGAAEIVQGVGRS
jgi:anti-sigma factor RsiW